MTEIDINLRRQLVELCRVRLLEAASLYEHMMKDAQEEANSHGGAMVSRYDTFKEEAQERKNGFALELQKTLDLIAKLNDVPLKGDGTIDFGSVVHAVDSATGVETNLFMFASLSRGGPLRLGGRDYHSISLVAPLGKQMRGKRAGDIVTFGAKQLRIVRVD